jgi:NADH-quinone oxidoreductase subunit M
LPDGMQHWTWLLMILLLGNIIYIGFATIAQNRLDWMLGYSSVMHMGYIFLGIATASVLGTTGAAVLMFAHGLSIALLFGIAGEIRHRTGTLFFEDLGGLGKVMPLAGLAFGVGAFAAIGLPGFANFAAEIMVFFGSFQKNWEIGQFHLFQIATVLALWGVVISAVYMLRAYRAAFMGTMPERWNGLIDLTQSLRIPLVLLIGGLAWFGFFPQKLVRIVSPVLQTSLSAPATPQQ